MKEVSILIVKTLGGLDMLVNQEVLTFKEGIGKELNSVLTNNKRIENFGIK
ncbi:MAG: hypothetical protein ACFFAN_13010 [Promethearchaeota archaeon]